jgi:Flp pilus assembly protein TadD
MSATAQTAESYNTAGIEKAQKGLFKEAVDDFTKAIELNPKYSEAYSKRAMLSDLAIKKARSLIIRKQ